MKKFLSILLALAVGFTFTFGSAMSAFAAQTAPTTSSDAQLYKEAVDYAVNTVASKNYDKAVVAGLAKDGLTISAKAWTEVKTDYMKAIEDAIGFDEDGKVNDTYYNHFSSTLTAEANAYACFNSLDWWAEATTADYILDDDNAALVLKAAKAEAKIKIDEAYDILATKIDLDAYTAENQKKVKAEVKNIVEAIDVLVDGNVTLTATAPTDWDTTYTSYFTKNTDGNYVAVPSAEAAPVWAEDTYYAGKPSYKNLATVTAVKAYVDELTPAASGKIMANVTQEYWSAAINGFTSAAADSTTGKYLITGIPGVETIAETAAGSPADTATKAGLKSQVSKASADFIADVIADSQIGTEAGKAFDTLKDAQEYAAAYEEVMNALIDEKLVTGNITAYDNTYKLKYNNTEGTWVATSEAVTELAAFAAKYKAQTDSEGNLVRDAAEIDKIVKQATKDLYAIGAGATPNPNPATYGDLNAAKEAITNTTVKSDAAKLTFEKNVAIAQMELDAEAKTEDCYALEAKAVATALETAKAAVNAAAKKADIEKAEYDFARALKAINNRTAVENLFNTGALATEINTQNTAVQKYVTYVNSSKKSYDDTYIVYNATACKEVLVDYYIEKDARTAAEVKAAAIDAAAVAAMLPTKGSRATAEKAYKDAVEALPATTLITAKDQAVIEAAIAAKEAAADNGLASVAAYETAISNAIDALEAAMKNDLWNEYASVSKTDKVALRAMQEKIDEFNKLYKEDKVLNENASNAPFEIAAIDSDLAKIKKTEMDAVIAAIDAFPLNITEANKAQVEAARALYDAYVADWTDVYDAANGYVADDITNYMALTNAETLLKDVPTDKFTDADAKAYVFDQTIKATSVKLSAKKVKVTANFDASKLVENGYTVEYKFYKSTKKSSGYKYTGVTKVEDAKTYTNTNAKKGKNYYKFKVVVKNADGTVILTTALKDCKYACRTIK